MSQRIFDVKFDLNFAIPIVLVIEPFETSWQRISDLSQAIIGSLPGRIDGLYFLGNSKQYNILLPQDFTKHAPRWFHENKARVSLLYPVLKKMEEEGFNGTIIVLCSKPPVDLEDWFESELLERTLFVTISDELSVFQGEIDLLDGNAGIHSILSAIENPPDEVWIESDGFVPLCYEINQGGNVAVEYRKNKFLLRILPQGEHLELHLKALSGASPILNLHRVKGQTEQIKGEDELPWCQTPNWEAIPSKIKPVVEAGINKGTYFCWQCEHEHRYDVLICPEGGPVLKEIQGDSCLLFNREKFLAFSNWYAWPLKNNQRIITRDGKLYEWQGKKWVYLKSVNFYEEVDNEVWALFHRL